MKMGSDWPVMADDALIDIADDEKGVYQESLGLDHFISDVRERDRRYSAGRSRQRTS
jgi:hypothetical protein